MDRKKKQVTVRAEMAVNHPVETIWPLLCPVREYEWIPVWECELLRSESGFNELGCVFRTEFPAEGGVDTWLTSRFDPHERIEFVRTNEQRVIYMTIELTTEGDGTHMVWTHHVTALNEDGESYVAQKSEAFTAQMSMLERMLVHYLDTGKPLPMAEES